MGTTNKALGEAIGVTLAIALGFLLVSPKLVAVKELLSPFVGIHSQVFIMGIYFSLVNVLDAPLVILYWVIIALTVGFIAGKKWGGAVTAFSVWGTMAIFGIISLSYVLSGLTELDATNYLKIIPDDFSIITILTLPLMDEILSFFQEVITLLITTGGKITFTGFFAIVWIFFKVFGLNLFMLMVIIIGFGFLGGWLNERFIKSREDQKGEETGVPPYYSSEESSDSYTEDYEIEDEEYPSWDDYINDEMKPSFSINKLIPHLSTINTLFVIIIIVSAAIVAPPMVNNPLNRTNVPKKPVNFSSLLKINPESHTQPNTLTTQTTITLQEFKSMLYSNSCPFSSYPTLEPKVANFYWENVSYYLQKDGKIATHSTFEGTNPVFQDTSVEGIDEAVLIMMLFSQGNVPVEYNPFYQLLGDAADFLSDLTLLMVYPTSTQEAYRAHAKWGKEVATQVNNLFNFDFELLLHAPFIQGADLLIYGDDQFELPGFLTKIKNDLLDNEGLAELINPQVISKRNGTMGLVIMKDLGAAFRIPAVGIHTIENDAFTQRGNQTFNVWDYEEYSGTLAKNPNALESRINIFLPKDSSGPTAYEPMNGYYNSTSKDFVIDLADDTLFPSGEITNAWINFNYNFPIDLDIYRSITSKTEIKLGEQVTVKITVKNHDETESATNVMVEDIFGKVYGDEANIISFEPTDRVTRTANGSIKATYPTIVAGATKEITYTVELQKPGRFILPTPQVNYTTAYLAGTHVDWAKKAEVYVSYTAKEWIQEFLQYYWFMIVIVFIFAMIDFLYWIAKEKR
ncbi:MAG: hypothetical protein GF308_09075 [Candidatus Heimdallarchaeota archaeon]|nr:hypothetical protein [Candidatus Heimdallarchaeota archaeon]